MRRSVGRVGVCLAAFCVVASSAGAAADGWQLLTVADIPPCAGASGAAALPNVAITGLGLSGRGPVAGWRDNCSVDSASVHREFWSAKTECAAPFAKSFLATPAGARQNFGIPTTSSPQMGVAPSSGHAIYVFPASATSGPYSDGTLTAFENWDQFVRDVDASVDTRTGVIGYVRTGTNGAYNQWAVAEGRKDLHYVRATGCGPGNPNAGQIVRDGIVLGTVGGASSTFQPIVVGVKSLAYAVDTVTDTHHIVLLDCANELLYLKNAGSTPTVPNYTDSEGHTQTRVTIAAPVKIMIGGADHAGQATGGLSLAVGPGSRLHLVIGGFEAAGASTGPTLHYVTTNTGFVQLLESEPGLRTDPASGAIVRVGAGHPSIAMNRRDTAIQACIAYWHASDGLNYLCGKGPEGTIQGPEVPERIGGPALVADAARSRGTRLVFDKTNAGQPTVLFFDAAAGKVQIATKDLAAPWTEAILPRAPATAFWYTHPADVTLTAHDCPGTGATTISSSVAPEDPADCSWCATDPLKVSGSSTTRTVAVEGLNTLTYSSADAAGNSERPRTVTIGIDTVAPTIAADLRYADTGEAAVIPADRQKTLPPDDWWFNRDVRVQFTCADPKIGNHTPSTLQGCSPQQTMTVNGETAVTGEATDKAGHRAWTKLTVRLDKTPPRAPTVTYAGLSATGATTAPGSLSYGWFGADTASVRVVTSCADDGNGSGIFFCSPKARVSRSGISTFDVVAEDLAGNRATTQAVVRIDRVKPSGAATLAQESVDRVSTTGWHRNPLVFNITCNDPFETTSTGRNTYEDVRSDIDPDSDCGKTVSRTLTESAYGSVRVLATNLVRDRAFNLGDPVYVTLVGVDVTPPGISCSLTPSSATVATIGSQSAYVDVTATVSASDEHSQVSGWALTHVFVLDDWENGSSCRFQDDVLGAAFGTADTSVRLRKERCRAMSPNGVNSTGRTYRFVYVATDVAGNTGEGTCDFRVTGGQ
jgi:hypothetical protein